METAYLAAKINRLRKELEESSSEQYKEAIRAQIKKLEDFLFRSGPSVGKY